MALSTKRPSGKNITIVLAVLLLAVVLMLGAQKDGFMPLQAAVAPVFESAGADGLCREFAGEFVCVDSDACEDESDVTHLSSTMQTQEDARADLRERCEEIADEEGQSFDCEPGCVSLGILWRLYSYETHINVDDSFTVTAVCEFARLCVGEPDDENSTETSV